MREIDALFREAEASSGTGSTAWCTPSPSRRARRSPATSSRACRARRSAQAHDISAYSFPALAKAALPMMKGRNASLLTLTYLGAVRVVPNYNTMGLAKASLEAAVRYLAASLGPQGIRVNGISAGPDQDARRGRHRRLRQDPEVRRGARAAAAQRHHRGRRQRGGVPALRPGRGRHRRDPLRRRRLQPRRRRHRQLDRPDYFFSRFAGVDADVGAALEAREVGFEVGRARQTRRARWSRPRSSRRLGLRPPW